MKKFGLWIAKTSLRVAFFVFLAWCYAHPGDSHWLDDIIPQWMGIGIALGLFWPIYSKWFKDLYNAILDDIAERVQKRVEPALRAIVDERAENSEYDRF